jgi:hypothetical protein
MAMGEWMRGARAACDRYAPTLALLDDPAIDPAERAEALAHLAGCALCQADRAADERIDAALRRAFGPQGAAPLRTRDLLVAIGATSEPTPHITVAPARGAASPIRSVVDLGDFEGGFERMSESEGGNGAANSAADSASNSAASDETSGAAAQSAQPAPARKVAAIPSLRPAPRGRPSSRAWAMGFSATAAAVILVVVAATLFSSRGRAPTHTAAHNASATATAQAKLVATALGPIAAISLDSPTDGWAIGDATPRQNLQSTGPITSVAALYHYDGTQWTLEQRVVGYQVFTTQNTSLRMFSATDGWAFGAYPNVLRYDGTSWRMEPISVAGTTEIFGVYSVDVVSPTEGWAIASSGAIGGSSTLAFLHFDGSQWTVEQLGITLPSDLDPQSMQTTHISALPGGDVWAIGNANITRSDVTPTAQNNGPNSRGFVIHRVHGVWKVEDIVSMPSGAIVTQFNDIQMTGSQSGWVVGLMRVNVQTVGGGPSAPVQQPLLLRYDGARWVAVRAPQDITASGEMLASVTASGPDHVWVLVGTSGENINANGESVSALFLRYDGAAWTEVQGVIPGVTYSSNVQISAMALGADGTLWGLGSTVKVKNQQGFYTPLIASYHNGVWSVATIATK